jgi:eukaryotic-like serine/threonine-protein kinase
MGLAYRPGRRMIQRVVDRKLYGFRFDLIQLETSSKTGQKTRQPGVYSGHKIGDFQLFEMIGKGGMAEVYRGEAKGLQAAVKILPPSVVTDLAVRRRLKHEMEVLSQFDHPNIMRFYDYGFMGSTHYLALEYIEGRDVQTLLMERGRLQVADAVWILQDIAAALETVHAKGIIHRDVKPSNILLRPMQDGYQAVLIDFGISYTVSNVTTLTGLYAIGTVNYISPEQIRSSEQIDHRADIYSLGVVAYEILTGELPFDGNAKEILFYHLHKPAPDPRIRVPKLPVNIAIAIMRALEKDPANRFDNVGQFAAALNMHGL